MVTNSLAEISAKSEESPANSTEFFPTDLIKKLIRLLNVLASYLLCRAFLCFNNSWYASLPGKGTLATPLFAAASATAVDTSK